MRVFNTNIFACQGKAENDDNFRTRCFAFIQDKICLHESLHTLCNVFTLLLHLGGIGVIIWSAIYRDVSVEVWTVTLVYLG